MTTYQGGTAASAHAAGSAADAGRSGERNVWRSMSDRRMLLVTAADRVHLGLISWACPPLDDPIAEYARAVVATLNASGAELSLFRCSTISYEMIAADCAGTGCGGGRELEIPFHTNLANPLVNSWGTTQATAPKRWQRRLRRNQELRGGLAWSKRVLAELQLLHLSEPLDTVIAVSQPRLNVIAAASFSRLTGVPFVECQGPALQEHLAYMTDAPDIETGARPAAVVGSAADVGAMIGEVLP
mgnify:CR=1 FL=1